SIDPFSPATRREVQGRGYPNLGCGAGNTVCSISLAGDVNPRSFLGPAYAAANPRERSLPEVWPERSGFCAVRAVPDAEATGGATFAGGCRARALVLNGSLNAPDPWIEVSATGAGGKTPSTGPATLWHPLAVIEVARRRPTSHA